jgi:hypothetical protein
VLRVPDREFERSDLGVDGFDLEHRRMVLGRRHELDVHADTLTTEDEIGETRVPELGKTSLLPEVEGDIANIRLNLAESELDLVFGLVVDNTVRRESEVVPGRHGDDIGEQVLAREGEVLDDEVESIVGVLDAGDGDVTDLADDGRQDNLADVVPKMGFELQRAFAVEEEVLRETSPVLAESFVQGIFAHLLEPVTNGLKTGSDIHLLQGPEEAHTWKRCQSGPYICHRRNDGRFRGSRDLRCCTGSRTYPGWRRTLRAYWLTCLNQFLSSSSLFASSYNASTASLIWSMLLPLANRSRSVLNSRVA